MVKRRREGESSDIGRAQYRGGVTTASEGTGELGRDGEKLPIKMLNDRILVKMDASGVGRAHPCGIAIWRDWPRLRKLATVDEVAVDAIAFR